MSAPRLAARVAARMRWWAEVGEQLARGRARSRSCSSPRRSARAVGRSVAPTPGHPQSGVASWYGPGFHGQPTSSGTIYDQHALTAAHPKLPLGTRARVTNLENGKSVEVLHQRSRPVRQGSRHRPLVRRRARDRHGRSRAPRVCRSTSSRAPRTARRTSRTACKSARSARRRRRARCAAALPLNMTTSISAPCRRARPHVSGARRTVCGTAARRVLRRRPSAELGLPAVVTEEPQR